MGDFSRGENRITRRPLVLLLVGHGSKGRVIDFRLPLSAINKPICRFSSESTDLRLNRSIQS